MRDRRMGKGWILLLALCCCIAGLPAWAEEGMPLPAAAKGLAEDLTNRVDKENLAAQDPQDLEGLAVYNLWKALAESRTLGEAKRYSTRAAVYGWALYVRAGGSLWQMGKLPGSGDQIILTLEGKKRHGPTFDLYLEGLMIGMMGLANRTLGKPEAPEWALVAYMLQETERLFKVHPFRKPGSFSPLFGEYGQAYYYLRLAARSRGILPELEVNVPSVVKYMEAGEDPFFRAAFSAELAVGVLKEDKGQAAEYFRLYLKNAEACKQRWRVVPLPLLYGGQDPPENERLVESLARKTLAGN